MQAIKKRMWALALLMAMVFALMPTQAFAASKTVKFLPGTTLNKVAMAKATTVKKGTTKLKFKTGTGSGFGILKFKATKTKYYTFTFSNVKSGSKSVVGDVQFGTMTPSKITLKRVKLSEGTRKFAPLFSADLANGQKITVGGSSFKRIAPRKVKIKLTKGQTIYLFCEFNDLNSNNVAATAKLVIK